MPISKPIINPFLFEDQFTMLSSLVLLFSCSSEAPEKTGKDIVITQQKHAVPKSDDHQKKSFFCCNDEQVKKIVSAHLSMTRLQAADKLEESVAKAKEYLALAEQHPDLSAEATAMASLWTTGKDIQDNMYTLNQQLIDLVQKHKSDSGDKIIVAFCPMVNPEGGRWLQPEPVIANPYYGSAMLTCGVFE